jgi:release factor glutamine methyltransferase
MNKNLSNNDQSDYLEELDDDQIHLTTRPYLNKVESHTVPYEVEVFGKNITVLPHVMSPKYDWAGLYMIDFLPNDFTGQDVLEIGPGTGLVSVFVGLRAANSVTALDINPNAVENTNLNLEKHKIKNAKALLSDVFSSVHGQMFDSIIFNLPYHDGEPRNDLEKGVIDAGYRAMDKFFAEVRFYLKDGGKMYVGFSRSGNLEKFNKTLEKNNVKIDVMEEKDVWDDPNYSGPDFNYNCQVYTLSLNKEQ